MSLKEEKHHLFRQLKTVLNEEDEKREKYEDLNDRYPFNYSYSACIYIQTFMRVWVMYGLTPGFEAVQDIPEAVYSTSRGQSLRAEPEGEKVNS